jgi:hypothetical protein
MISWRRWRSLLLPHLRAHLLVACTCGVAAAQRVESAHGDPYVGDGVTELGRAGIVGHGPAFIGRFFGTSEVDEVLDPDHRLLWLETEHFVIGSRLPAYPLSDGDSTQREKLRQELSQLRERLPRIERDVRLLDPWLRQHLFAQRCESVYRDFLEVLALRDDAFPTKGTVPVGATDFRGIGPYLGMRGKLVVLLFATREDLSRVSMQIFGESWVTPTARDLGHGLGFMVAAAADESIGLHDDTELHVRVVDALVRSACQGLCAALFDVPAWARVGLALEFVRAVDPDHPGFDRRSGRILAERASVDWSEHALGLARRRSGRPLAELILVRDEAEFGFNDQVALWSRVAWLRSTRREQFARFLVDLKQPLWPGPGTPDFERILEHQATTLHRCFHVESVDDLDEQWRRAHRSGG